MTAVNVNALGNIGQVNQPVHLQGKKEAITREEFQNVMKSKVANVNGSDGLKVEERIKQPAKRTEIKKDGMVKTKNLDQPKTAKTPKSDSDIQDISEEIIAGAAQILNITPEELKAALESLNLKVGDLTDKNSVAQLILNLNGSSDISDMLVDNGMLEAFNELNTFIRETLNEAGLTKQDFKAYMKVFEAKTPEPVLTENAEEDRTDRVDDENIGNIVGQDTENKGPEVTVTKEESESGASLSGKQESDTRAIKTSDDSGHVNLAEGFIRNLEMAVEQTGEAENVPDIREIVYQVVERIKVDISPDNTSLEMQLNPENLGKVSINITNKGGVMTAQINTENRQAKEAIESQLQILKENIEAKGIRVEAVEVRISDFNFADSKNSDSRSQESQEDGGRSGRRNQGSDIGSIEGTEEIAEAQRIAREVLENEGSTVSYTA